MDIFPRYEKDSGVFGYLLWAYKQYCNPKMPKDQLTEPLVVLKIYKAIFEATVCESLCSDCQRRSITMKPLKIDEIMFDVQPSDICQQLRNIEGKMDLETVFEIRKIMDQISYEPTMSYQYNNLSEQITAIEISVKRLVGYSSLIETKQDAQFYISELKTINKKLQGNLTEILKSFREINIALNPARGVKVAAGRKGESCSTWSTIIKVAAAALLIYLQPNSIPETPMASRIKGMVGQNKIQGTARAEGLFSHHETQEVEGAMIPTLRGTEYLGEAKEENSTSQPGESQTEGLTPEEKKLWEKIFAPCLEKIHAWWKKHDITHRTKMKSIHAAMGVLATLLVEGRKEGIGWEKTAQKCIVTFAFRVAVVEIFSSSVDQILTSFLLALTFKFGPEYYDRLSSWIESAKLRAKKILPRRSRKNKKKSKMS